MSKMKVYKGVKGIPPDDPPKYFMTNELTIVLANGNEFTISKGTRGGGLSIRVSHKAKGDQMEILPMMSNVVEVR